MSELGAGKPPKIISIVNQKGGVGKTTTTINLGAALGGQGLKTLIVDLDPQGNASTGLGILAEDRLITTYDLLLEEAELGEAIQTTSFENLSIIPTTTDLSSADIELVSNEKRSFLLHDCLRSIDIDSFDFDVFKTVIPRNVRLSEAPSFAMPIREYDGMSKGSLAYEDLAKELMSNWS